MSAFSPINAQQSLAAYYAHLTDTADIGDAAVSELKQVFIKDVNVPVFLKMEALQPDAYSFKVRGAYNKMRLLKKKERERGVITASAGNHAQGVAKAARKLGIAATIVMPKTTPPVKIKNVRGLNPVANVVLHGDSFPEALAHTQKLKKQHKLTFVHPYDDELVIAGQGTIAREIFAQYQTLVTENNENKTPITEIFVPIGGGGLIAGIAAWVKFHHPNVKIIGAESHDSNCMDRAVKAGRRVKLGRVGIFADGVAVAQAGKKTYDVVRQYVDEIICVSDREISLAAVEILGETRATVEPAGAMAVAAMKKYRNYAGGAVAGIVSGGNVSPERLQDMLELANGEALLSIALPEKPGSLKDLCEYLGDYNVTKFKYRFVGEGQEAHILIGLGTKDASTEAPQLIERLQKAGYPNTKDETNNELVREHISKMVGGHPRQSIDEMLYSFEFLEKPGELREFLRAMPDGCNITLFDYQNRGKARGHVLMGFTAQLEKRVELQKFLKNKRWNSKNQTSNPAYADFLQPARKPRKLAKVPRPRELALAA